MKKDPMTLQLLAHYFDAACDERDRLRVINADLLAALRNYQNFDLTLEERQNQAMAVITKAEGR